MQGHPSVAAARCAAAISGPGPDLGPGPEPGSRSSPAPPRVHDRGVFSANHENGHETDF